MKLRHYDQYCPGIKGPDPHCPDCDCCLVVLDVQSEDFQSSMNYPTFCPKCGVALNIIRFVGFEAVRRNIIEELHSDIDHNKRN